MSATPNPNRKKVTTHSLRAKKARGEPITMLTALSGTAMVLPRVTPVATPAFSMTSSAWR